MKRELVSKLKEIKRDEKRKKDKFAEIPRNFYREVVEEIEEMQIAAKNYFDKGEYEKGAKLNEEIIKAKNSLEEIMDIRIRKILMAAVSETIQVKNITKEELSLFNDIKDMVENFKRSIMNREPVEMIKEKIEIVPVEEKPKEEEKKEEEEKYVLARVIAQGVKIALPNGKDLELRKEDVLHLPEKIYNILLKRDKVEEIKTS